tara:strand:- start:994 stop:2634 length:1641 start_codon:yes stop_codon:yes gene_type:complete
MKLTKSRLKEIIREELSKIEEISGVGTTFGARKRIGYKSPEQVTKHTTKKSKKTAKHTAHAAEKTAAGDYETKDQAYSTKAGEYDTHKSAYDTAATDYDTKLADYTTKHQAYADKLAAEPAQTKDVADTTKWTHPKTGVTHTLGQGQTAPAKGWSYRQATTSTVPDTTKWTHPYSSKTTTLGKGQTAPKAGWAYDTTTTDYSKFTHPLSKKTVALHPSQQTAEKRPTKAWSWTKLQVDKPGDAKPINNVRPQNNLAQQFNPGAPIQNLEPAKPGDAKPVQNLPVYRQGTAKSYASDLSPGVGYVKGKAQDISYPTSKTTSYGQGTDADYAQVQKGAQVGGGTWAGKTPDIKHSGLKASKAVTTPTKTSTAYKTSYGQGSTQDYTTAQAGSGRDQWAVADTTTPMKTIANPDYSTWESEKTSAKDVADAAAALKSTAASAKASQLALKQSAETAKQQALSQRTAAKSAWDTRKATKTTADTEASQAEQEWYDQMMADYKATFTDAPPVGGYYGGTGGTGTGKKGGKKGKKKKNESKSIKLKDLIKGF